MLNMFRTWIYPSSGACDYSVELPHWSYCSWFDVCWSFGVFGLERYPCCRLKLCFSLQHGYNIYTVVIQQNSRKPLMMNIFMSETCWAHKKWNKIASDIKLVFYSSTITMMHSPINIRCYLLHELFLPMYVSSLFQAVTYLLFQTFIFLCFWLFDETGSFSKN